ncbi:B12-binding domain-containing radical SAM protein [Methanobacterium alcaliphilum]|uniref:B12-binding domain-containing radical SAM protein n=1 Tax=Methanobacterium alcaliphilum TaxID=392018 RepID=UPI00200A204E|nr:radical SAM protein [Methanobacterium alcaliphilum]MCK9152578.1 B12-binding domain-containing radical SAM protein [Methanobacterium alcaliphilum]
MKVLLINPPYNNSKYKFIGLVAPPLGISYIAAVLEENNIEVQIIDGAALEMSWAELENEINKISPDVIGITALTPTITQAITTAKLSKKICPDATIIMGGYHPTFTYQELLKEGFIDIVIKGEGEYTLLELVNALENDSSLEKVKGIATADFVTPQREVIQDIDKLPFPARHLLPMDKYRILNIKLPTGTMISGRGCPYQCSFCSSSAMHGAQMRMRSVDSVVDEMEHLINEHDAKMIAFMDDTFTLNRKRVEEICDEIKRRNIDVFWGCTTRVDTIVPEMMAKMRDSGCITLFMGVESSDQQILNNVNKKTSLTKIKNSFKLARSYDIRTIASVVLGMPGDTRENILRTIKFVKNLDPNYAIFSLATPYPGTSFHRQAVSDNLIKVNDWSKYTLLSPVLETVDCSLEELKNLQKRAFRSFYLRPSYLLKQARMDGFILIKTAARIIKEV